VIRLVEPGLVGTPERVQDYVDFFAFQFLGDDRLFPYNVRATVGADGATELSGFVGYEENRATLLKYLGYMGFTNIRDAIEVLPSAALGDKRQGFVVASNAFTYSNPVPPREQVTTVLLGDPVWLLRRDESGMYLIQSAEGYLGYIDAEAILPVDAERFAEYNAGAQLLFTRDVAKRDGSFLVPAGARLKGRVSEGRDALLAEHPDGRRISLPRDAATPTSGAPDPRVEGAIQAARRMLGTPYEWGGKSTKDGIDCSGLVQTAFRTQGISMPRDADQQALVGTMTATRFNRAGMRRGDLMFFIGRHGTIHHVAIYMGEGQYIEAAGPGVVITSLDPAAPNYNPARDRSFCFAKRVFE
jgi:gamma-D-glutamyl-L-lysine dipeptidyl-peptidase